MHLRVRAAEGAEFAYSKGAIGVLDLLDARRQLYATRLELSNTLADYAKLLEADRSEIEALYHDILISVTSFFRDPEMFEFRSKKGY